MTTTSVTTPGILYIVATPIGNQEDITLRAIDVLKQVDVILAEDTRHSKKLLKNLNIEGQLWSFHAFNEERKSEKIILALKEGMSFALISDAGTPLISDPGYPIVEEARKQSIPVIPIPGPCALIAALSAAGVPTDTFTFTGFLPAKAAARQQSLKSLSALPHTLIFYESTHRIKACLDDIGLIFGNHCEVVLAKELTKAYERIISGRLEEVIAWLYQDEMHVKGEFVVIIPPREIKPQQEELVTSLTVLLNHLPLKQAVKIATELTGINKNTLYQLALELKS